LDLSSRLANANSLISTFPDQAHPSGTFPVELALEEPAYAASERQDPPVLNPEATLAPSVNEVRENNQQEEPSDERRILSPAHFEATQAE